MEMSQVAKTGRRFYRESRPDRVYEIQGNAMVYWVLKTSSGQGLFEKEEVTMEMVTARDWRAEPVTLQLSAADIVGAAKHGGLQELMAKRRLSAVECATEICKQLGLLEEGERV